jgi:hypothetical protein
MPVSEPNTIAVSPRFFSRENVADESPAKNYSRLAANAFAKAARLAGLCHKKSCESSGGKPTTNQ